MVILVLAIVLIAGCTQQPTGQAIGETKYVCPDGSTVARRELCPQVQQPSEQKCTPNWQCTNWSDCTSGTQSRTCNDLNNCETISERPIELQTCIPKLRSNVYTDADVSLAINTGKTLKEQTAWNNFFKNYFVLVSSNDAYTIMTPYEMAVSYVRNKVVNYDEISESTVRTFLEINQLATIIITRTDNYYIGTYNTGDIRVLIKDGDKIYKAGTISANSEMSSDIYDLRYKTTITASGIPNYEDFAKKVVELIIVISNKETKYTVDMSKFK